MELNKIYQGDCLEVMKTFEDNSVDSIVSDPPYGISFMGKKWDYDVPSVEIWKEALRVLKPGGHALIACGTRTQHRMAVNLEDAGFEIRDIVAWVYGSGFPKSLNIGKVMDKFLKTGNASWNGTGDSSSGALGYSKLQHSQDYRPADYSNRHQNKDEITEEQAKKWEGWGTALKPAMELWTLCRKPLEEKTVAENVLKYGTGGINVDGCRVEFQGEADYKESTEKNQHADFGTKPMTGNNTYGDWSMIQPKNYQPTGRFPANLIHDGSDEVVELFPNTKSSGGSFKADDYEERDTATNFTRGDFVGRNDSGSASRFFYCAKASKSERNKGLDGFKNTHPTLKPVKLMEYLCRLVTPKNGIVLDPFMGSGSTVIGAKNENFNFIGIELDPEYCKIAQARIGDTEIEKFDIQEIEKPINKPIIEKQEIIQQTKNDIHKCPNCGGRLVKTNSGLTCEDCLEDF
ncbi:MAG TPA: DNA methyltransferase [bacterium]|nr:DNA methyltransferase [bacterium]